ncbi:uncharacterized protein PHALS_11584 [Plasmopara halstedii]|uniref:Uncharacterized protein n=1 Tax=Plasmopara halstedii TaxID=4781 RepID=A0A0P1AKV9_PLAHL|nr:uncharacterized protein PHALS_11584 [Plasmopara halstedii]CEG41222.1 hypothetical protein PHALS_11584 [Plasmopara halstedii]|eukprot:XP_024577591.1 hypothetical protein PHALS_11584 [Plasmopara halstedii]
MLFLDSGTYQWAFSSALRSATLPYVNLATNENIHGLLKGEHFFRFAITASRLGESAD